MIEIVNANFSLVHRYYHQKVQILGHKLKDYDRYAPLSDENTTMTYSQALEEVLNTLKAFSPEFHKIASKAIKRAGWIHTLKTLSKAGLLAMEQCLALTLMCY